MPKSPDALYLLALLTYAIVDANSVDPNQQQSSLFHCLTQRFFLRAQLDQRNNKYYLFNIKKEVGLIYEKDMGNEKEKS